MEFVIDSFLLFVCCGDKHTIGMFKYFCGYNKVVKENKKIFIPTRQIMK
jgi:hypothetical protein